MNQTFDEATKIQEQLIAASGDLVKAQMDAEQASYAVRQTEQDVENAKVLLYAEQLALGKEGVLTGGNEAARKAQFEKFLEEQPDGVLSKSKLKAQKATEVNAKITLQTAQTKFQALRAVADLTVRKLEFETQLLISETQVKIIEAAKLQNHKEQHVSDSTTK